MAADVLKLTATYDGDPIVTHGGTALHEFVFMTS